MRGLARPHNQMFRVINKGNLNLHLRPLGVFYIKECNSITTVFAVSSTQYLAARLLAVTRTTMLLHTKEWRCPLFVVPRQNVFLYNTHLFNKSATVI